MVWGFLAPLQPLFPAPSQSLSHFLKLQPQEGRGSFPVGGWATSWALGLLGSGCRGLFGELRSMHGGQCEVLPAWWCGEPPPGSPELGRPSCPCPEDSVGSRPWLVWAVVAAAPTEGPTDTQGHTGHWAQPALDTWGSCLWVGSGADPEQGSLSVDREATSLGPGDPTKR